MRPAGISRAVPSGKVLKKPGGRSKNHRPSVRRSDGGTRAAELPALVHELVERLGVLEHQHLAVILDAEVQAAARRLELARARLEAHRTQVEIISFGYRLGQGSTEEMIKLWQAGEELRGQITEAESDLARASTRLRAQVQGATS